MKIQGSDQGHKLLLQVSQGGAVWIEVGVLAFWMFCLMSCLVMSQKSLIIHMH